MAVSRTNIFDEKRVAVASKGYKNMERALLSAGMSYPTITNIMSEVRGQTMVTCTFEEDENPVIREITFEKRDQIGSANLFAVGISYYGERRPEVYEVVI
ncbi:MAG: hypothetical protein HY514_02850 [Candidatus Aenigmarchaeota archaeon]|nr:hypothetical protein [Candidatus Aenigmarchaeota archaeon]